MQRSLGKQASEASRDILSRRRDVFIKSKVNQAKVNQVPNPSRSTTVIENMSDLGAGQILLGSKVRERAAGHLYNAS